MSEEKGNWVDDFRELINGGYILLFMFGGTICLMSLSSLIAAMLTDNPSKITLLTKVMDTCIGFMLGAFSTMWNNQNHKASSKNGRETVEVTSNPSDGGLKIQEVTLKKDEPLTQGEKDV